MGKKQRSKNDFAWLRQMKASERVHNEEQHKGNHDHIALKMARKMNIYKVKGTASKKFKIARKK